MNPIPRIWVKKEERMFHCDQLCTWAFKPDGSWRVTVWHEPTELNRGGREPLHRRVFTDETAVLMWSFGRKDSNGKEMFDGDIVERKSCETMYRYLIAKDNVRFKVERAFIRFPDGNGFYEMETFPAWFTPFEMEELKIIGNVWKSPLLVPDRMGWV